MSGAVRRFGSTATRKNSDSAGHRSKCTTWKQIDGARGCANVNAQSRNEAGDGIRPMRQACGQRQGKATARQGRASATEAVARDWLRMTRVNSQQTQTKGVGRGVEQEIR